METKGEVKVSETKIILPAPEGTFIYVAVKGMLASMDCIIFGLTVDEIHALLVRYQRGNIQYDNGTHVKAGPIAIVNSLAELGYRVVASTGETEITWTLQREI